MGWERRGENWYYYRRSRVGGTFAAEYIGAASGTIARARAQVDADRRALLADRRRALEAGRASAARALAEDRGWFDHLESLTLAALDSAGFHRPNRCAWRRRRMGPAKGMSEGGPAGLALAAAAPPAVLAPTVEKALLAQFLPNDPDSRRRVAAEMERLRAELGGPDPSPLERLLIGRVALCWFQVHAFEALCARDRPGMERRRDQAHKRYLQSIRCLAQVRRLERPAVPSGVS